MAQSRQLAAIMFTDIVGYTTLMGKNEEEAITIIRRNKEIHKKWLRRYKGKWLKEMGDGVLASFRTISDAVYCAGAIMKEINKIEELNLRIGIHQGEIIADGNEIYGDGVNIASRIEGLAEPGQILVSESIYNNIKNRQGIRIELRGEQKLKNVDEPIKVYTLAIKDNQISVPTKKSILENKLIVFGAGLAAVIIVIYGLIQFTPEASQTPENKLNNSIAVLPFDDFSPEGNQQWLSDGLMDAINNNLTKINDLRVIARASMMRYKDSNKGISDIAEELNVTHLLQGSVLRYEDNIRINVQLITAEDRSQKWSKSFDQKMSNIFDILNEVAFNVGRELETHLTAEEVSVRPSEKTNNVEAYELYLRAKYIMSNSWGASPPIVKHLLDRAIKLDSLFARPYSYLGLYWLSQTTWNGSREGEVEEYVENAMENLNTANSLDPEYGYTYLSMGAVKLFHNQELIEARDLMLKGLKLDPSPYNKSYLANTVLPAIGEFEYAHQLVLEAMKDSPFDPGAWAGKALVEYFLGDHANARKTLEKGMQQFEESNLYMTAGRVYYALEEYHKVLEILQKYLIQYPDIRPARTLGYLAMAHYKLGNTELFTEFVDEIKDQAKVSSIGSPAFHLAMIHAQIRENDTAFEWLEKAYRDHEVELYWLKIEPPFEPLYDDPRWQEMLDKVGFSEFPEA